MKKNNLIKAKILRWLVAIFVCGIALMFSGCYGTYYISDAEYSDLRESHSSLTYYQGDLYWGWNDGWYYYYGKPHYYPWYYYYTMLPPYQYNVHTHVYIHCNNGYYVYGHRKNKFNNTNGGNFNNVSVKVKPHRTNVTNKPSHHVCGYSCNDDCLRNNKNNNNKIYITPNRNHNTNSNRNNVNKSKNNNIKINKNNTNRNRNNTNTKRKPR